MNAQKTVAQKEFYLALEGIRGIAALIVASRHISSFAPIKTPTSYLAVDLFFVLSGFVLAFRYEDDLRLQKSTTWEFFLNRLIRIYPLYIVGSVIGLMCLAMSSEYSTIDLLQLSVLSSLFLPDLISFKPPIYPLNHPAWSLFFELIFGLLYARWLAHRGSLALGLLSLLSLAILLVGMFIRRNGDIGYQPNLFLFGFFRISFSFCVGVLIFRHRALLSAKLLNGRRVPTLAVYTVTVIALALPLPQKYELVAIAYAFVVTTVLFPALVICGINSAPTGRMAKISIWLGVISFPLYALHVPLDTAAELFAQSILSVSLGLYAPFSGFVILSLITMLAFLSATYVDLPLRLWLKRKLTRQNKHLAPVSAPRG